MNPIMNPIKNPVMNGFRQEYFAFWVFISITWSFVATFVIIVLPIQESWDSILGVGYFMLGKQRPAEKSEKSEKIANEADL